MSNLLKGIRVLELGRFVAAPWCGQILADLGANVIKVEQTRGGDQLRSFGPWLVDKSTGKKTRDSSYFVAFNRSKRSITIDFSQSQGQDLVRRLAKQSDVLIENFKAGDLSKFGLDKNSIQKIHPDLIYLSITGFGQTGPYANWPGMDSVFQCMSGLVSVTGEPDGPPTKAGVTLVDLITGMYGVIGCLAALRGKEVHGRSGQSIDLALLDSAVAIMSHRAQEYLLTGEVPKATGTATPKVAASRIFRCADGWLNLQAGDDGAYQKFCKELNRKDLLEDSRFTTLASRWEHHAVLTSEIETELAKHSVGELHQRLSDAGVVCSPVYTMDQTFADPQVIHRRVQRSVAHPLAGEIPIIANPLHFSETPVEKYAPPPTLGQHTLEILEELGYSDTCIQHLQQSGVI